MGIEISALDPADESTVADALAVRVAAEAADSPGFPPPDLAGFRGELRYQSASRRSGRFVARLDGEVAGYLAVDLPTRDNLENSEMTPFVHPARRRRGVGRALHAYLLTWLRDQGRKRYWTSTVAPLPGGPPRSDAGGAFAAAMGAERVLLEVRRRLKLASVDESTLTGLAAAARARAGDYQLVSWCDRAPEEYAADVGYLDGRLTSDAPMGELTWEVPAIDAARVREGERRLAAGHWRSYCTGAVHQPTNRLVAITKLVGQRATPWHLEQWITLVDPAHRGHRLGTLVKLANLDQARAHRPELQTVDTWNAEDNPRMIAINEAMGFRPVDRWPHWQREV